MTFTYILASFIFITIGGIPVNKYYKCSVYKSKKMKYTYY